MFEIFGKNSNLNIDEKILRKNKIPFLHTDPNWIKLFGDVKDKDIINLKEDLKEKVDKEKEIENEVKKLEKEKLKSMKMILGVSDSINNENKKENIKFLDEYKDRIEIINNDLEELTFELETIPQEIREANVKLLNATIKYGYNELKIKEEVLDKSTEELYILRTRLKELINIKHDYEEWIDETYTFFHGLLGSKIIEEIDKERLR